MNNVDTRGIRGWQRAADFAAEAHHEQWMESRRTRFTAHPCRVALIVASEFGCQDEEAIAVALLHDVIEKAGVTGAELATGFGTSVADQVARLSKVPDEPEDVYWRRLAASPWQVRLVKMADALDHLDCPVEQLPERIRKADRALELAFSGEASLLRAKDCLRKAVDRACLWLRDGER
jgi:(p)ppGpp synthase/HD superfamily hydrolase